MAGSEQTSEHATRIFRAVSSQVLCSVLVWIALGNCTKNIRSSSRRLTGMGAMLKRSVLFRSRFSLSDYFVIAPDYIRIYSLSAAGPLQRKGSRASQSLWIGV